MEIDRQYTDTHGAPVVGFAFAHMLGSNLLPRLKNVGSARLYRLRPTRTRSGRTRRRCCRPRRSAGT
ncbi:Tn3 family transposase [Streptomyces sp. NPDC057325]|uniref:Tn3 family transposase n=1 Tax=unclassified Streptomyces TaxID=2593676 RepID=UPI003630B521